MTFKDVHSISQIKAAAVEPFSLFASSAAGASAPLLCDAVAAAASAAAAAAAAASSSNPVLNVAALLASGTQVTPQIAMAAQMAALQAKTLAETGIAVPSYYNPSAVNPMKFAEQEKKRKLLWQGKKEGVGITKYSTVLLFQLVYLKNLLPYCALLYLILEAMEHYT